MSLVFGAILALLTIILYRIVLVAVPARPDSHWVHGWLIADVIVCLLAGLSVFSVILLAKGLADLHAGPWQIADLETIAGGIAVAAVVWLVVTIRRRAAAADARPSDPLAP